MWVLGWAASALFPTTWHRFNWISWEQEILLVASDAIFPTEYPNGARVRIASSSRGRQISRWIGHSQQTGGALSAKLIRVTRTFDEIMNRPEGGPGRRTIPTNLDGAFYPGFGMFLHEARQETLCKSLGFAILNGRGEMAERLKAAVC